MKNLILLFFFALSVTISGCALFDKGEGDLGHCDKELFEKVKKDGSIRVIAEYDMEYIPENQLNEEEKQAQREMIAEMHDRLLTYMEGMSISGVNKLTVVPRIAMGVDEKALIFLCNSKLVKQVRIERIFQTN